MYPLAAQFHFFSHQMKESAGVRKIVSCHDFQVYDCICSIANPSPEERAGISFPHPEALTAEQIGSLLPGLRKEFVVEALLYQQSILKYHKHGDQRDCYMFPAYFQSQFPDEVCRDCCGFGVVAGRWMELRTEHEARQFIIYLAEEVLSSIDINTSVASESGFFFRVGQVQCVIECATRVRSLGVLIRVCCRSTTRALAAKSQSILELVVELAHELSCRLPVNIEVGIVSSKDLRAGRAVPHIFSYSEVKQAREASRSVVVNSSRMYEAETFYDLLLTPSLHEVRYSL